MTMTIAKEPRCQTCGDTGWKTNPDANRGRGSVERCRDCFEHRRGFAPGVPELEQHIRLDSWGRGERKRTKDNADALQHAEFFVQGVHPGLYLHGGVGSGKTTLACAILNDLHLAGTSVRFVRVTELLKQLVQGETGDQVYDRMVNVPVLCLDDVGAQKGSDYARQMLLVIYESRTDKGHRTIWTSNLDLDELVIFMGEDERLASRIAGHAKIVRVDGEDYRLRALKQQQRISR
jgi:DNA replication protein DnaC